MQNTFLTVSRYFQNSASLIVFVRKKNNPISMANQKAVFIAKFCKFMRWYDDRRKLTFQVDFSLSKYFYKNRNTPTSSIKTVIMAGFSYILTKKDIQPGRSSLYILDAVLLLTLFLPEGMSVNDVPHFLTIFDLPTYLVLLPLPILIWDVIH